jgi:hypothetical protein
MVEVTYHWGATKAEVPARAVFGTDKFDTDKYVQICG